MPAIRARAKCEHGRQRSHCKECKGIGICEHGRIKSRCKECKGGSICEHGRIKYQCKECKGSKFCEHDKIKYKCKECKGSQICEHGKIKTYCKECKGSQICEHGSYKARCKECKGTQICEHGRIKYYCKKCKGTQVCEHGKDKNRCLECKGDQICEHNKIKWYCKECDGSYLCTTCKYTQVKKKDSQCGTCCTVAKKRSRVKESVIAAYLQEWHEEKWIDLYTSWNKANPDSAQATCGKPRPDFLWDKGFCVVDLEVDEYQHKYASYDPRCELVRMARIVEGYGEIPVHFIRYNPDAFKIGIVTRKTGLQERLAKLKWRLKLALERPAMVGVTIEYIWYDQDAEVVGDNEPFVDIKHFQTLRDYEAWVDQVCPLPAQDVGDTSDDEECSTSVTPAVEAGTPRSCVPDTHSP